MHLTISRLADTTERIVELVRLRSGSREHTAKLEVYLGDEPRYAPSRGKVTVALPELPLVPLDRAHVEDRLLLLAAVRDAATLLEAEAQQRIAPAPCGKAKT